jgi:hypothetical protein
MKHSIWMSILLLVALAGCNLPGAPTPGTPPTPTGVAPTSPPTDLPTVDQAVPATAVSTDTPAAVVPIPATSIQIDGVPYSAYQMPGDPFRFVCQEPCPLDPQYIYAEYAGFRLGHARLIALTGIDTLAELQPVDMHLVLDDSICKELPAGHAYVYAHKHQAYTCSDGPGYYPTVQEKIEVAARVDGQYFPLHEYMHTLFFGRLSGKAGNVDEYKAAFFHDYVVPVPSYAIGILDPAGFCSNRDPNAPGDYGGWLISELCNRNGFQLADLSTSLVQLDALYQSGGGQVAQPGYAHPAPSVAQYRDILNKVLGGDTTQAFAAACWPPVLFGNSFSSPPACGSNAPAGTATPIK